MAFPTTTVFDDFNRANTGPPPSVSWSNDYRGINTAARGFKIISNEAAGNDAAYNTTWWSADVFGPDSEAGLKIGSVALTSGQTAGLLVRGQQPGGSSTVDGYEVDFLAQAGTDIVQIYRLDNGTYTQLGADISYEFNNSGDMVGAEVVGTTISAYHKPAAGSWTLVGSRTDSTYAGAGVIGFALDSTSARLDDFFGGTVGTAVSNAPETVRVLASPLRW